MNDKALKKMNDEMTKPHSKTLDTIHNWLCEQDDPELADGIMADGKTIEQALNYCTTMARQEAVNGAACIDSETVFKWVADYFKGKGTAPQAAAPAQPKRNPISPKKAKPEAEETPQTEVGAQPIKKKEEPKGAIQLDIFGMI